jgi:hypothetical protein
MSESKGILHQIKVASPCGVSWNAMQGDERVRVCAECDRHVYDFSEMKTREIEALMRTTEGRICAAIYRRRDGTVITADCPVGLREKAARVRRRLAVAFSGFATVASAFAQSTKAPEKQGQVEEAVKPALAATVKDPTGAVVPGAAVTITNEKTGEKTSLKTDDHGLFRLSTLPEGTYMITVEVLGFRKFIQKNIAVRSARTAALEITLMVGVVGEVVTVGEVAPFTVPGKLK